MCIGKTLIRGAVLFALAGGAVALVAQTPQGSAALSQVKQNVSDTIDSHIDDPVALRNQLRKLAAEYPERIEAVRNDLSEVSANVAELQREAAVGERVMELTRADYESLESLIAKAENARGKNGFRNVSISFDGDRFDLSGAYARANRVAATHSAYAARQDDIARDLDLLSQQETRLAELLTQLETEQSEFQAQLWQLDQQVDAIARNERMIELMEKRDRAIAKHDRYESHSLDEVRGKIADRLANQEARLASLAAGQANESYEDRARFELETLRRATETFRDEPGDLRKLNNPAFEFELDPIEIGEDEAEPIEEETDTRIGSLR